MARPSCEFLPAVSFSSLALLGLFGRPTKTATLRMLSISQFPAMSKSTFHWISKIHKLISHFKPANFNLQMNCSAVAFAVLFLSLRCYCEKLDLNSDLTVPFHVIENREDKTMNDGNQLRPLHGGVKATSKRNVNCGDGEMYCMDGQTCCLSYSGGFGCCPVPNAICCNNGVHCCPQGYICDYGSGGCRKSWSFV